MRTPADEQRLALLDDDLVHLALPDGELVATKPPEAEEVTPVHDLVAVDPDAHQAPDLVPAHVEDMALFGADLDLVTNIPLVWCLHDAPPCSGALPTLWWRKRQVLDHAAACG